MHDTPGDSPDERDVAAYRRDGVVCLRGLFSGSWIELLRAAFERALGAPGPEAESYTAPGDPGHFCDDQNLWRRDPDFRRFAFESPAAGIAARLMDASRVRLLFDHMFLKEPGTDAPTPWHQDQPYWAIAGHQVCSVWLALDPVGRDAAVEYVAGSHLWEEHFPPRRFADGTPYAGQAPDGLPDFDDPAERARRTILSWALEPGDCLVFHAMTVHGAPGNPRAARRRRALSVRFAGEDARYVRPSGPVAFPPEDPGLAGGAPLSGPLFPVVWPSGRGEAE